MSSYVFCNYIKFRQPSGSSYIDTSYYFQNFSINTNRTRNSVVYSFAPFALATGGGEKGGDQASNTLVTAASTVIGSTIILNLFKQAIESRWLLQVETVSLDPTTFIDDQLISSETWRISSYEMDTKVIKLNLSSPLDAARAQVPRRRLSSFLVGALPTSGQITI